MQDLNITHVLAVHDTAEAHWPEVGLKSRISTLFSIDLDS